MPRTKTGTVALHGFHGEKLVRDVTVFPWNALFVVVAKKDEGRLFDAIGEYCPGGGCLCGGPVDVVPTLSGDMLVGQTTFFEN